MATRYGIRPLSHPAVRQPCSSDKMDLISSGAVGRATLFRLELFPEQTTHHAPKAGHGRATGRPLNTTRPVRLQTSRRARLAYRL
ncbi:MAG TPA: hypothetical protein VHS13_05425 [Edaphobacter sp.]|nr:hypothetical protein [Edaphobacter sp.]